MNDIAKYDVLKWICYLGIILSSYLLKQNISSNLKFIIANKVWCPAFGGTAKCNLAILISGMGVCSGFGLLLIGVLSDNEEKSLIRFLYKSEPILSLAQIPVWLGLIKNFTLWTKEVEIPGWEIWCLYLYSIINILLLISSVILCLVQKNVVSSRRN